MNLFSSLADYLASTDYSRNETQTCSTEISIICVHKRLKRAGGTNFSNKLAFMPPEADPGFGFVGQVERRRCKNRGTAVTGVGLYGVKYGDGCPPTH